LNLAALREVLTDVATLSFTAALIWLDTVLTTVPSFFSTLTLPSENL
jgi:hypothetical protein